MDKNKILITIGILGILLFSAFLFTLKFQGKIIPFETVSKGERLGYLNNETMQPMYIILTNKNELDSFFDKFGARAREIINFSENDFKEYILICAYFGYAPSTGYEIEIKKIVKKERTVEVIIQSRVPKYGEEQLTSPYHIVKVKRNYFEPGKHIFVFKNTAGKELNCIEMEFKEEVISANGTIEYISLEGGFYGIVTDEGEKYLPLNLPEEFKKEGLRVWFKAKPKNVATNQMWGKPIEILEIKLIKVQNL
ncbi:MAG: protease complex subunit PrcB family protein, partial [Thermoproteales archaeon]|nr:protease complex subunit PrcB family protein [Thermoproteales archaeon]